VTEKDSLWMRERSGSEQITQNSIHLSKPHRALSTAGVVLNFESFKPVPPAASAVLITRVIGTPPAAVPTGTFLAMGWDHVSVELRPLRSNCPSPIWHMSEYGAVVEWYWQGKTDWEKYISQCIFVHHMDRPGSKPGLPRMRNRRLTAWAVTWPRACCKKQINV
jgi:hypothetical protein